MLAYALFMIVTRKLSGIDTPFVTLFYSLLVGLIGGAIFAIPEWVWPASAFEWVLLLALGALGGSATICSSTPIAWRRLHPSRRFSISSS